MAKEYFIDHDESSDWYLIRADKRKEWIDWVNSLSSDLPPYAQYIEHPYTIIFSNPREQNG